MAVNIGPKIGIDGEAEYRKQLNNIVQQTKTLDAQMKKVESTFNSEGDAMKKNQAKTEILEKKKEALQKQIEESQKAVESATEKYGENSTQALKWEASIAKAEAELASTENQISALNDEADTMTSALGSLTDEMNAQQSELDTLKSAYVSAVLEFGEGSDEANALADEISALSSDLQDNKSALDSAMASADSFDATLSDTAEDANDLGGVAQNMAGQFGGAWGSMASAIMAGGVAGAMDEIIGLAVDIGKQVLESAEQWDLAMSTIATGTGYTGEALDNLTESAKRANAEIANANSDFNDTASIMAEVNTRFGLTGESAESLTTAIAQFSKANGVKDATAMVDDLANVCNRYGIEAEDLAKSGGLLDQLTQAQTMSSESAESLASNLSNGAYQLQAMGYGTAEALGLMVGFADAGGSASNAVSVLNKAYNKLNNEGVADVSSAMSEAIEMVQNASDKEAVLNEVIGDTGLTIADVFGRQSGETIMSLSSMTGSVDDYSNSIKSADGITKQIYDDTVTWKDEFSRFGETFKITLGQRFSESLGQASKGLAELSNGEGDAEKGLEDFVGGLASLANSPYYEQLSANAVKGFSTKPVDEFKSAIDSAGKYIDSKWESMANHAKNSFSNAVSNVKTKAEEMKTKFRDVSDNIKHFLDFKSWNIKTPHFTVTPKNWTIKDLPTKGLPSMGIQWYARAYNTPMMLTDATIFGMSGSTLLGGGERAGNEIIVGESLLTEMMQTAVNDSMTQIYGLLAEYLPKCSGDIYLDGNALVGGTVERMDSALGTIMLQRG